MARLNLQLFAKATVTKQQIASGSSKKNVNDIAKEVIAGKWGNGSARKTALQNAGYNYSEVQSAVNSMMGSSGSKSSSSKPSNSTKTSSSTPKTSSSTPKTSSGSSKISSISGVDQVLTDKINSSYAESSKVTNAKNEASASLDAYKGLASTPFQESQAYLDAMAYTNTLLQQLSSGRTSYTDQIKDLMGQIQNRDPFEYDVDTDTLFQQSLASAMGSGKIAMQDTMGQAAALTGGYGSTYAQNVGNQAYNSYVENAYNNIPEYYEMAMEAYQMEGQEMYNQLAMLNDADATEFQRMYDSWNANFSNAQQMYQNEYAEWQSNIDNAYNVYSATQGYADTMYAQEYQKWADEVANAMSYANMQNSDYWNTQNFIEQQNQFQKEMNYKYAALKQDNDQFYASLNAKSSGGGNSSGGGSNTPSGVDTDKIPSSISSKASKLKTNGELAQYLDGLVDSGQLTEAQADHLYSANMTPEQVGITERDWTMTNDGGWNWFGAGIDADAKVKDQYGNEYSLADLRKELKKTMTTKEANDWIKKLEKQLGI